MVSRKTILDLTGLPDTTLNRWIAAGYVVPAVAGKPGRDQGAKFTPAQAIGLAVASEIHRSERGCVASFVGQVYAAFASVPLVELNYRLRKEGVYFVQPHHGKLWLAKDDPYNSRSNVQAIAKKVLAAEELVEAETEELAASL